MHIDSDLLQLAKTRRYTIDSKTDYGAWLYWSDDSERIGHRPWIDVFEPFQLFREDPGGPPILSLYVLEKLPEKLSLIQKFYRETVQALETPSDKPSIDKIDQLTRMRDAAKENMHRQANQLVLYLAFVQRIIQVWVAEMERISDEAESGADNAMAMPYRDARRLWLYMSRGIPQRGLLSLLSGTDKKYIIPPLVAHSTQVGLLYFHDQIAPIHAKLNHVDAKRSVCEELINAILLDKPLPTFEDVVEKIGRSKGRRPVYSIDDTERWFIDLSMKEEYQNRGGKTKLIYKIIDLHFDKTQHSPDERTIWRHIQLIKEKLSKLP